MDVPVSSDDAYPPGQVTDLTVMVTDRLEDSENVSITLTWTAPGDELDLGTVKRYELKYSDNAEDLLDHMFDRNSDRIITEDLIHAGSLEPRQAGTVQSVAFLLPVDPLKDRPYYVALRAVDKADKVSPVSNLARFYITEDPLVSEVMEENASTSYYRQAFIVVASIGMVTVVALTATLLIFVIKRLRHPGPYRIVPA